MSESIHGHQVMEMMATSGKNYSKVALKSEIASTFGAEARFHTCMGSDMSADDLIEFLASKGKFIESEQGISMPEEHLC
tara:strand:+ start:7622 stop:7858 length:237 start_codon:yes stop_codon:yes gene_type:complete